MDEGKKLLLNMAADIAGMSDEVRRVLRSASKLIQVNRVNVANFSDYAEPLRLGPRLGFR